MSLLTAIYNILAAITIADFYKIGLTNIIDSISNFSPLPHRIEFVHSYENVDYRQSRVVDRVCESDP